MMSLRDRYYSTTWGSYRYLNIIAPVNVLMVCLFLKRAAGIVFLPLHSYVVSFWILFFVFACIFCAPRAPGNICKLDYLLIYCLAALTCSGVKKTPGKTG